MTRKKGLLLVLAVTLAASGVAAAGGGEAGSTYLDVFGIGVGAGPSGMAAYAAAPGDLWSLTYNPAGLAGISRRALCASQIQWIEDTSYSYFGAGMPRAGGGFALGLAYFDLGSVEVFDGDGNNLNMSADAYNFGVIAGYGTEVPKVGGLSAGVSGHVIQGSYDGESASAIGMNLGLQYGALQDRVRVAAVVRNLGTRFRFDDGEDEQTLTFAGGVSCGTRRGQIPNVEVLVGLDALMPKNRDAFVAAGGEVLLYEVLALRAGYSGASDMGNMSYGAGFRYGRVRLDYTYTDHDDLSDTHRFSLTVAFEEGG